MEDRRIVTVATLKKYQQERLIMYERCKHVMSVADTQFLATAGTLTKLALDSDMVLLDENREELKESVMKVF